MININTIINFIEEKYPNLEEKYPNIGARLKWATTEYQNGLTNTEKPNVKQKRAEAKEQEKNWGNLMNYQQNNTQWTTKLGENLVFDILDILGENPRKPQKINGQLPDWETDKNIYEVKTRNWTTPGSIGDKVIGVPYKYSDIPETYGKPLKIILVAYQEYEFTHGRIKIFDEVSDLQKEQLKLWKKQNIEFIKFSDLVTSIINS